MAREQSRWVSGFLTVIRLFQSRKLHSARWAAAHFPVGLLHPAWRRIMCVEGVRASFNWPTHDLA